MRPAVPILLDGSESPFFGSRYLFVNENLAIRVSEFRSIGLTSCCFDSFQNSNLVILLYGPKILCYNILEKNLCGEAMKEQISAPDTQNRVILYTASDRKVTADVFFAQETFWLTQRTMAELFGINMPAISKHLKNIYASGELLEEATVSKMETVQMEGGGVKSLAK
jgi:hypothetical protein